MGGNRAVQEVRWGLGGEASLSAIASACGNGCRSGWLLSSGERLIGKLQSHLKFAGKNPFIVHLAADDKAVLSDFLRAKSLVEGHRSVVAAVAADDPLGCLMLDRREKEPLHQLVGES